MANLTDVNDPIYTQNPNWLRPGETSAQWQERTGTTDAQMTEQHPTPTTPSTTITSDMFSQQPLVNLPQMTTTPTGNILAGITAENQSLATVKPPDDPSNQYNTATGQLNPKYTGAGAIPPYLQAYLDTPAPPSAADQYTAMYGKPPTKEELAAKEQAQQEATAQLNALNAQLAGVTASSQAANLQLEQEAGGKDVTGTYLGRQQQEVNRQAAIQALPVQAQILAQQAIVQNNTNLLNSAQAKVNDYFKLVMQDMDNKYNYNLALGEKVFQYMTKQEQRQWDTKEKQETRDYNMMINNLNQAQTWATSAISQGQGSLAGQIMALDPKSANYQVELGRLASQIKPKATGTAGKVYNAKTIPGSIRQSVIDTMDDAETTGQDLTIESMMSMFPEVDKETLQSYLDEFYTPPVAPKGKGIINKVGDWLGSAWSFVWGK